MEFIINSSNTRTGKKRRPIQSVEDGGCCTVARWRSSIAWGSFGSMRPIVPSASSGAWRPWLAPAPPDRRAVSRLSQPFHSELTGDPATGLVDQWSGIGQAALPRVLTRYDGCRVQRQHNAHALHCVQDRTYTAGFQCSTHTKKKPPIWRLPRFALKEFSTAKHINTSWWSIDESRDQFTTSVSSRGTQMKSDLAFPDLILWCLHWQPFTPFSPPFGVIDPFAGYGGAALNKGVRAPVVWPSEICPTRSRRNEKLHTVWCGLSQISCARNIASTFQRKTGGRINVLRIISSAKHK